MSARFSGRNSCHWLGGSTIVRENRRAAALGLLVGSGVTEYDWLAILARFEHRCGWCRKHSSEVRLEMDHIVPLCRGGTHQPHNVQPLCKTCNNRKARRPTWFLSTGEAYDEGDVVALLRKVVQEQVPIEAIVSLNWSYLNDRAVGEQKDLAVNVPGIEAYEDVAPKAKPVSRK